MDKKEEFMNKKFKKNKEGKGDEVQRIVLSKEGQVALEAVVEKVNNGFIGGKVSKTQTANWIIMNFNKNLIEVSINEIRNEYYDEVAMLEFIVRKAKESGKISTEYKSLLQKQLSMSVPLKKSIKKMSTENNAKDNSVESDVI